MSRRGPLIAGIVFLLAAILVYFFLVSPKMKDVGEAEDRLDAAVSEEQSLQSTLARLREVQQDAPEIRRELAVVRQKVPPVADLPGLINLLQTAADTAGVDFFAVSPGDPVPSPAGNAVEIPAQIRVVGDFFAVDEFLFRLETLKRAAEVVTLGITTGPDGLPSLQMELQAHFFTTDLEAGPGAPAPAPTPSPAPSPSPGASPSPAVSPTPGV